LVRVGESPVPIAGDELDAYLALALVRGIGPSRLRNLLAVFGSAGRALTRPLEELTAVPSIGTEAARAIREADVGLGRAARERVAELGGVVLIPGDPRFPAQLLEIAEPPAALFALGRIELVQAPAVAIVGSRDHSSYGAEVCRAIAAGAAEAGIVVVSGMARGLDAVAHRAALDVSGATIGVLGNGLGIVYPLANRGLYDAVVKRGLLLTEFPPGERPSPGSFPRRNRLIAGLARATVVVEAAVGSGALITAAAALDQGRDVLAVPGPITNARSHGTNRLIRDGAKPLLELADLLELYPEVTRRAPRLEADPDSPRGRLLTRLADGAYQVDDLAQRLGWRTGELLGLLGALEVEGLVVQRPGMVFARANPPI
jgi:DNA processing protein